MEMREAGLRILSLGTLREMAAISLSILAAFAVDAGWETRQDRNAEREILGDLVVEAEANLRELEAVTERQKNRVRRIEVLLEDLQGSPSAIGVDSITALGSLMTASLFRPRTGVMRELVASGDMRLLENRELRNRIAGFEEAISSYTGNSGALAERYLEPTRDRVVPADWVERPISTNAREVSNYLDWVSRMTRLIIAQSEDLAEELNTIRTLAGGP